MRANLEMDAAGKPHLSDQELLNKYRLLAPQTLVALLRLNLFVRLIVKGSDALKGQFMLPEDLTNHG